ncbi:MAG: hypothetical protein FD160_1244 [Caulobacteraceae bacterium]|nr:MAG: hypothetical protein FD160_1244 [Caulobacteraceae bacterium]
MSDDASLMKSRVQSIYANAQLGDLAGAVALLGNEVTWSLVRPAAEESARGSAAVLEYLTMVAREAPSDSQIALERVAVAEDFAFAVHVEAPGGPREHRHVLVFKFVDGVIVHVWELTLGGPESENGVPINIYLGGSTAAPSGGGA